MARSAMSGELRTVLRFLNEWRRSAGAPPASLRESLSAIRENDLGSAFVRPVCGLFIVAVTLCWSIWPAQSHLLDKQATRQLAELLRQQHYIWGSDLHYRAYCVGRIRAHAGTYWIYYDNLVNPADQHGVQNVVVLKDGRRLVGAYTLESGGEEGVPIVSGTDVVFRQLGATYGNRIHFGEKGPPSTAWVDGYVIPFGPGVR